MLQQVRPFIAKVALAQYQAVILDTAVRGQVDLPGGANAKIVGYAMNAAAIGQEVAVVLVGPTFRGIAGASVGIGDYLMGEGTDGRLKEYAADNTLQHACAISLEDGEDGQEIEIILLAFMAETALS
jgi:hypothetical protein